MDKKKVFYDYVMPFIPFLAAAGWILFEPGDQFAEAVTLQRDGLNESALRPEGRCNDQDGDAALNALIMRLAPQDGANIRVDVFEEGPFLVAAAGKDRIVVTQAALTMTNQAQLAALLAHEISHLRENNDYFAEMGDAGSLDEVLDVPTWRGGGFYTLEEEEYADQDAMDMLLEAGIPVYPAVNLYNEAASYEEFGRHYAYEQFNLHPGLPERAMIWNQAARTDYSIRRSALDYQVNEALYDYCGAPAFVDSTVRVETAP